METYLIFHEGFELPLFASYPLLGTAEGRKRLRTYYRRHMIIAADCGMGFVLESPTWRASRRWGEQLGHDAVELRRFNLDAIALLSDLRAEAPQGKPCIVSGNIGPRGDGYRPDETLTAEEAEAYHAEQIGWFAETDADIVSAFTITTVAEAVGIIRAAKKKSLRTVVSFTVETDGRLPDGTPLGEAIKRTDAETDGAAEYLMINCAHPDHFRHAVAAGAKWLERIGGIRANASRLSHAELDAAEELDDGNPAELAGAYDELLDMLPNLRVLGGCCGTDHRHVAAIASACRHHNPQGVPV
ncbi:homocysteine S-methyltransferase [Fulvimarina pelagi HTCC2506]|uniref:Homocysteine S-methyltransferase n=2 Tax=Fulvimarina pelagi TaxID=217511 RepID=Q0G2R1_9HYPH|nr:homocysteine S-methyltransferase [Fulvimarina pelagi HTCC2506]